MEHQNELNRNIALATKKIEEEYPELTKYLGEMPEDLLPNANQKINEKDLKAYLDSLNALMENYGQEHTIC